MWFTLVPTLLARLSDSSNPIHRLGFLARLEGAALRQFRRRCHIAGVTIVLLQHRCAGSHVLSQDELVNALLKPKRSVGVSQGIDRPLVPMAVGLNTR